MIHLDPLPGTPNYQAGSFNRLLEKAKHEANIYAENKIVRFLLFCEKMVHEIPRNV